MQTEQETILLGLGRGQKVLQSWKIKEDWNLSRNQMKHRAFSQNPYWWLKETNIMIVHGAFLFAFCIYTELSHLIYTNTVYHSSISLSVELFAKPC